MLAHLAEPVVYHRPEAVCLSILTPVVRIITAARRDL